MRDGVNPEKIKNEKNQFFYHRIIIPIHIPNLTETYYKESLKVFETCFNSLINTINPQTTVLTIINNNSCGEVGKKLTYYFEKGFINKYVVYNENKGKVYSVLSEAKSSYEDFITIADADVLFFSGWERANFNIFKHFKKAGVVAPLPSQNSAFIHNTSIFFDHFWTKKIKYDKIVKDRDCDLYINGMGNLALHRRSNKPFSWREKQYYLRNGVSAIVGCGHFVATYRRQIFENVNEFPEIKFQNGFEDFFLDEPADRLGWYRLSTRKTYAYHIGNKLDEFVLNINFDGRQIEKDLFHEIEHPSKTVISYNFRKKHFKILKKLMDL